LSASTVNGYKYSAEYKTHVVDNSEKWQAISARCKERAGHRCQVCNKKPPFLHAHHRTYDHIGDEKDGDLIALCQDCHELFHGAKKYGGPAEILAAFGEIIEWLQADKINQIQITHNPFRLVKIQTRAGTYGAITAPHLDAWILQAINLIRALGRNGAP